jgi:hypothetical protein
VSELDLSDHSMRLWANLANRPVGPLAFRFLLQPAASASLAICGGIQDGRGKATPYLWAIIFDAGNRALRMREGLHSTGKIIILAAAIEIIYQLMVLREFHPGEALIVAVTMGFVPYQPIRGPAGRLTRLLRDMQGRSRV